MAYAFQLAHNSLKLMSTCAIDTAPAFALPEYRVIERLLPGINRRCLGIDDAIARLSETPTLVPIAIKPAPEGGRIYFADLERYRYREWQHILTIERLLRADVIKEFFSAPADLLDMPDLVPDPVSPRGFILHMSRCGSTLLGKAMSRADAIGVINQPAPLQHGFWEWITDHWQNNELSRPANIRRFRNLLYLLCRPRIAGERDIFIKFISWNTLYADFIHQVFPDVPMVFLYRNPVEVIASVRRETTAILLARHSRLAEFLTRMPMDEVENLDDLDYLAACYANYFDAVLYGKAEPKLLHYAGLAQQSLTQILESAFGLHPTRRQLEQMRAQFSVYSKDDSNHSSFTGDSDRKREELNVEQKQRLECYYAESWRLLARSPRNVAPA